MPRLRLAALVAGLLLSAAARADDTEFFEKRVRPLIVEHCQPCHGPQKQKGGLRLTSRELLLKGGDTGPVVVPGNPDKSLLVEAVGYAGDVRMPPKGKLADEQIADLTDWVKRGAVWPESAAGAATTAAATFDLEARKKHWSFQPVKAGPPPAVKDSAWPINDIDRFILAGLETAGIAPAKPADKRTLLRRVTFDLIGLPPTPEETAAFLADESPTAYEKVVERLLASPAYGERWGRHWLDLVRYAETSGHEFDFEIADAWRYRDYVIRSFNADLPFDRFLCEQVAGDLLPEPRRNPADGTNESLVATGFWYLGESAHSPVDVRLDQAVRVDNQIDVFGKAFLGLTVSCARCHDHKFDAITQADYYALAGYLRSSRQQRAFINDPAASRAALAELQAAHDQMRGLIAAALTKRDRTSPPPALKPLLEASTDFANRKRTLAAEWKAQADRARADLERCVPVVPFGSDFAGWTATGPAFGERPLRPGDLALRYDRLVASPTADSSRYGTELQGNLRSPTFRLDKKYLLFRTAGTGCRVRLIVDNYQLIQDPIYGGLQFTPARVEPTWHAMDVARWAGQYGYIELLEDGPGFVALERVVASDSPQPPADGPNELLRGLLDDPALTTPPDFASALDRLVTHLVADWRDGNALTAPQAELLNLLLFSGRSTPAVDIPGLSEHIKRQKKLAAALPAPRRATAIADGTALDEQLFIRGNPKTPGPIVPRHFLTALDGTPTSDSGSGRLILANRLTDPANPLVARVFVNRLWHHHFGAGLVRTPDDFGKQGEPPTHPELLDWLAAEFVKGEWSVKRLHRLIVLSQTYRMASRADPAADAADPQNRKWHRQNVRRLEAEAIRDAILAVSGRLDRTVGGPSVPVHLTPFMQGRGLPGVSGPLDGYGRRTVYLAVRRNFLDPLLTAFDYPTPFTTMGRRNVSNVPAQALALLNDPFVVEQARNWATRELAGPPRPAADRVAAMYERAFGRPPTPTESTDALSFLAAQARDYGRPDDPRAWSDLAHVLVNVKEFLFVP